uniref:Ovule protein n=1 Tax=Heterorhabditis bacteriophora TaxID=37862 RepID=A0A1I7WX57_HETBA
MAYEYYYKLILYYKLFLLFLLIFQGFSCCFKLRRFLLKLLVQLAKVELWLSLEQLWTFSLMKIFHLFLMLLK